MADKPIEPQEVIAAVMGLELNGWTEGYRPEVLWPGTYTPDEVMKYRQVSTLVMSALDAAGYAVVPKVSTKEMEDAGWKVSEESSAEWKSCTPAMLYSAMIAAASEPKSPVLDSIGRGSPYRFPGAHQGIDGMWY